MADRSTLERLLTPLRDRLLLLASRAVLRRVYEGGGLVQLEGFGGGVSDRVERWGVVGIASYPLAGIELLPIAIGGSQSHLVVAAEDDRQRRPKDLQEGETIVYAADGSVARIRLRNGGIEIEASGDVSVIASGDVDVEASGSVSIDAADSVSIATAQASVEAPQVTLGEGLALALMNETLVDWLNNHSHPGTGSPTSSVPVTTKTIATKAS